METLKPTKAEIKKAMTIMGSFGGRAVSKKKGKKYMAELGRKGAKMRWSKKGRSNKPKK